MRKAQNESEIKNLKKRVVESVVVQFSAFYAPRAGTYRGSLLRIHHASIMLCADLLLGSASKCGLADNLGGNLDDWESRFSASVPELAFRLSWRRVADTTPQFRRELSEAGQRYQL
jgi:hypothetical protein